MATVYSLALLFASLVGLPACSLIQSDPSTSEEDDDGVTVAKTADELVVTNRTSETIWTFAAGRETLTTILWAPTVDEEGIAPGSSKQIAIADIAKASDEEEVVVFWWQATSEDGERVPGEVQSITIAL